MDKVVKVADQDVAGVVHTLPTTVCKLRVPFGNISKFCEGLHPNYIVQPGDGGPSGHPILHCQRAICEDLAVNRIRVDGAYTGIIADVGGSVTRHTRYMRSDVHCCCPVITAQDYVRNQKYVNHTGWCDHKIMQCTCNDGPLLLVHSLYYIDLDDLVSLLSVRKLAVAVVHEFPEGNSGFLAHGEARWTRTKTISNGFTDNNIEMSVVGCASSYKHKECDWLRRGGTYSNIDGTVVWNLYCAPVGDSYIYEFFYTPFYVPRDGPTRLLLEETDILSTERTARMYTIVGQFSYPTLLVSLLTTRVLGMEKGYDLASVVAYSLQLYRQYPHWRTIENDFDYSLMVLAQHVLERCKALRRRLVVKWYIRWFNGMVRVFAWLLILPLRLCRWIESCWLIVYVCSTFRSIRAGYCNRLRPIREGAFINIRPDGRRNRPGMVYCYGNFIPGYQPQCHEDSQASEIVSVRNRAIMMVQQYDTVSWESFMRWFRREQPILLPYKEVLPVPFKVWNRRFPHPRQLQHIRALANIRNVGASKSNLRLWAKRKAFVKRELLLEDFEESDPRLIQGICPEANVLLAPWILSFSEYIKDLWSLSTNTAFACGYDALVLGSWMNDKENLQFVENDFSRFDSSVHDLAIQLEEEIYTACGLTGDALKMFQHQRFTSGYTSHNIHYGVPATRKSGDPNTTLGNSIINMLMSKYVFQCITGEHWSKIPILVGGDDSVIGLKVKCSRQLIVDEFRKLGFIAKPVLTVYPNVTFYSARFVPSASGFILTPKFGRTLSKCGHTITRQDEPMKWLKGIAVANASLHGHVNFLYSYFRHIKVCIEGDYLVCNRQFKLFTSRVYSPSVSPFIKFMVLVYGITCEELLQLEEYLSNVNVCGLIQHPVLTKILLIDVGEPLLGDSLV